MLHKLYDLLSRGTIKSGASITRKYLNSPEGYLFGHGNTVPTDAATGWAPGALFIHTDGVGGTTTYINVGTKASCNFDEISADILARDMTLAASKTLAITTADKLTVGGLIVPQELELAFTLPPLATITEFDLWVATAAYQVTKIRMVPSTLQGGALTGTVVKAVSTATPVKTTTPMHAADLLDFNTGAYTVQSPTLTATTADLQLAAGNRIALDLSAAKTAGHAALGITLKRI